MVEYWVQRMTKDVGIHLAEMLAGWIWREFRLAVEALQEGVEFYEEMRWCIYIEKID